jgi:energy-coupling factor transport system substrate-specific component
MKNGSRVVPVASLIIASLAGVAAFLYPFLLPPARSGQAGYEVAGQSATIFLIFMPILVGLIFGGLMRKAGSKEIAFLSALTAVNVALRFVPLPLGGSAIFFLLLLAGYSWGGTFGFLLGNLTILISAFWAGGLGPWVPFQMVAAGWVGLSGGLFFRFKTYAKHSPGDRIIIAALAITGFVWGYLFGAIMNLWFWPYLGSAARGMAAVKQYLGFYLATSAFWDTGRAVVNLVLIAALGGPVVRVFERFRRRFDVTIL